jgi:hypothetical protein
MTRKLVFVGVGVLALLTAVAPVRAAPKSPPAAPVHIVVDVSRAPEAKAWAEKAGSLAAKWYPLIAELLKSDGFTPPKELKLVFEKSGGVAGTSGNVIHINAGWIRKHPRDYGMVIHEMVHVVQSYPRPDPGWVTEGIADYIRFFHFEPKTKLPPPDAKKASYRDSYQTTAAFFAWIEKKYDPKIVNRLNRAMRESKYSDALFKKYTGKSLDGLWQEYAALRAKKR